MRRINGRDLLRAWRLVREAGQNLFERRVADRLPQLAGWGALRLPDEGLAREPRITVLDALQAIELVSSREARGRSAVGLVGTLPERFETVLETRHVAQDLIVSAKREVMVVGFDITDKHFKELLRRSAIDNGVRITVVSDQTPKRSAQISDLAATWPALAPPLKALQNVESPEGRCGVMHAKVIVADRQRALVGSANFTWSGFSNNLELGLRIEGTAAESLCQVIETLEQKRWLVPVPL